MADHNDLLLQAEDLAEMIIQAPEVASYKKEEQKLRDNAEAQSLMTRVKDLQEQIADYSARNVPEQYYKSIVDESESLLEQLEKIPEVQSFQEAQNAINELLKDISDRLALAVLQHIAPQSLENSQE